MAHPFSILPNCSDPMELPKFGQTTIEQDLDICEFSRTAITALRVYFGFSIFNFIYIIATTAAYVYCVVSAQRYRHTSIDMSAAQIEHTQEEVARSRRRDSLRKRSLFGPCLGAFGHLIFSSGIFVYESFFSIITCDILLWCTLIGFYTWMFALCWRGYRLHFLLRVHDLRQRYLRLSGEEHVERQTDKEYQWFLKNRDFKAIRTRRPVAIYLVSVCIIGATCAVAEHFSIESGVGQCQFAWGSYLMMGYVALFFVLVAPALVWYLRGNQDAHGIRNEIMVDVSVGIPCFILYVIWIGVFRAHGLANTNQTMRLVFPGANWILIMTSVGHIVSIVIPLFKYLRQKPGFAPFRSRETSFPLADNLGAQPRDAQENYPLELTTDSLNRVFSDPKMMRVLREWAIKDFSVENVLFYERYLRLVSCVQKNNTTLHPVEKLLTTPITSDLIPDFADFYATFICDNAPLQVNITYKARLRIDNLLGNGQVMYDVHRPSWKNAMSSLLTAATRFSPGPSPPSNVVPREEDTEYFFMEDQKTKQDYRLPPASPSPSSTTSVVRMDGESNRTTGQESTSEPRQVFTLEIFEEARQEVFWNIFSGLFPRLVEAYKS
ncbi:hypothetical protein DFQ28_008530 [Apophysomyces sp. BC1034]|nr:hypothetical protein DFQ30_008250 [Apophysomyces sp. BC1015]KAG0178367.1 hypothetical protein DFQ29_003571 [Apophysomyces sp. BC1021]KAG0185955.1 hypothetical protein DFQ28_008530 [Apophysomyces sp. BC1034]